MKKLILCASVALATVLSYGFVTANENTTNDTKEINNTTATEQKDVNILSVDHYIGSVYQSIDFGKSKKLDSAVFAKGFYGYLNLKNEGKLANDNILTICDFSKSSTAYRLWVIDMKERKVLINDYVAHGQGSGDEFATAFSNTENSHQSSLGFYVTDETYIGKHGKSLRLHGMDKGYNSAAYDRAVVIHGAAYVSDDFVKGQKRLGRSWGCPAVSEKIASAMIDQIKGGSCLFVYHPSKDYLQTAYWLNKKLDLNTNDMRQIAAVSKVKRDTVIIYENGYKPTAPMSTAGTL